ncbi:MAG: MFS transporter [Firmicutes bacterium]|nr:MFS transporter [Bacillota bacterium]
MMQSEISRSPGMLSMNRNAWLVTITSLAGWTLVNMDGSFFTFSYPLIQKQFHITTQQVSFLYTGIFLIGAVVTFVIGPVLDRLGRKGVFQFTLLATALGSLLSGLAFNFTSLFVFRGITQVGASSEWMAGQVMVAEEAPNHTRGWWVGFAQIGWPVGWFIASLLSLALVPTLGWRWLFVIGVVPALFTLWVRRNVQETDRFQDIKKIRQQLDENRAAEARYATNTAKVNEFTYAQLFEPDLARTSILVFLWQLIYNYGAASIIYWLPELFIHYGLPLTSEYATSAWATGLAIIGYLSAAVLGEKFGRREVSALYLAIGAVSGLLLGLKGTTWIAITVFYAGFYFFAIGQMGAAVAFALESFPTRARGTGGTLLAVATWVGFIAAGLTGPILFSAWGVPATIAVWGGLCAIIPAILALGTRRVKPGVALEEIAQ